MPQFDLATYSSQIFWLLVSFLLVLGVSVFYTFPRLQKVFQERWKKIQGTQQTAKDLHDQRHLLMQADERHLAETRQKAQEEILKSTQSLEYEKSRKKEEILHQSRKILKRVEKDLLHHKKDLEKALPDMAQAVTLQILTRFLSKNVDKAQVTRSFALMIKKQGKEREGPDV